MKKYLIQYYKNTTEIIATNYVLKGENIQEMVDFETLLIRLEKRPDLKVTYLGEF